MCSVRFIFTFRDQFSSVICFFNLSLYSQIRFCNINSSLDSNASLIQRVFALHRPHPYILDFLDLNWWIPQQQFLWPYHGFSSYLPSVVRHVNHLHMLGSGSLVGCGLQDFMCRLSWRGGESYITSDEILWPCMVQGWKCYSVMPLTSGEGVGEGS